MATYDLTNITPFRAVHVGEILKTELQARQIKQCELAKDTGIQTSTLSAIIHGKRNITAEQSIHIGRVLNIPEDFCYRVQTKYDLDCVRIAERENKKTNNHNQTLPHIITTRPHPTQPIA